MSLAPKRILLVDDNADIHADFRKILEINDNDTSFNKLKSELFAGTENNSESNVVSTYVLDSAYQGKEALEYVKQAKIDREPYALAFVDIRMPPGWDGIETIQQIRAIDKDMQIVICTAYSDYSWKDMIKRLKISDHFLILKKPFEAIEIHQLAAALTKKWELTRLINKQINLLEETVQVRTLELQKAKEMAEHANLLKSDFLENISHELLTPLTSIIGFSQILKDKDIETVKMREFASYILHSTHQLMFMLNNILTVAKIDSGGMECHYENIDLQALIDEIHNMHPESIKQKNLILNINIDPNLLNITSDFAKLQQIIFNLLSNAVKFTPSNGKIDINIKHVDQQQFSIEVIDTGIGISEEDKKKLFVNFQQLDSSTSKYYAGIGMGLALVRHIVESQGGTVGVKSKYGKGSTFYITLPYTPVK